MRKIYIIIIIVLLIFIGSLSYYKFFYNNSGKQKKDLINTIKINEDKKEIKKESKDSDTYSNNIITKLITSYDYELEIENKNIIGKIFIGTDKHLYITDTLNNISYKVSDEKFTTMRRKEENNKSILIVYLISEDGKIFAVQLSSINVKEILINNIYASYKAVNFTDITFKTNSLIPNNDLIVLADDGYMYDAFTGAKYDESTISLDNMYYIYSDKTISNVYGNMLKDENGNYFKIKYYLQFLDKNRIFNEAFSIIITVDNRLIYVEENTNTLKIYNKKIKSLNYELMDNGIEVKVNLTFKDNTKMNLTALYTNYYGFE